MLGWECFPGGWRPVTMEGSGVRLLGRAEQEPEQVGLAGLGTELDVIPGTMRSW